MDDQNLLPFSIQEVQIACWYSSISQISSSSKQTLQAMLLLGWLIFDSCLWRTLIGTGTHNINSLIKEEIGLSDIL